MLTQVQTPPPQGFTQGPIETRQYDDARRLLQVTNSVNGAYTRWVYDSGGTLVQQFATIQDGAGEAYSAQVFDGAGRTRAVAQDHPGSTGQYSGQYTVFDVMGRVAQQSNPTEMNSQWVAAGDDATAGWIYTLQAYDWKGRPTVTTNADKTQRTVTYGGCGCAGGEVVTAKDEAGRQRRTTADVLGRLAKAEELNWDGSVYATANYAYDPLDHLTSINHESQVRSFGYDGYGRLQTRTTPEQGQTTYSYFDDDTVQTVTDARGATTTFGYNNRNLVTSISYGVAAGVAATANVSLAYDAAGNRTSMTDGLGSVSYNFNQLSQMTSETRTFSGVGSFMLSYGYNLAGELTSITGPSQFGSVQVGYNYDKIGRPTSVAGANYAGVTSYVNSITYRAFGMKQTAYANGKTLSLSYDNRLRLTRWDTPGVMGWNYAYNYFNENNGRVTYAQNLYDTTLDRSYQYDHVGRLVSSHTGQEALAHTGQSSDWTITGPYSQDRSYDQFGNAVNRTGWGGYQGGGFNYNYTFANNRLVQDPATGATLQYDTAGDLINDGYEAFTYYATGQQATASYSGYSLTQDYDGDGLRARKNDNGTVTYYLRSSVLGGQVVAEMNSSGALTRGYVYFGSQLCAIQQSNNVYWSFQDPITKSQRISDSSGNVASTVDLDPWGGETWRSSNQAFQPHRYTSYERDANGGDEAMMRRYQSYWNRFSQSDPYDGSYDTTDPQSFNRYAYVQNDPVNFIDPTGLYLYDDPADARGWHGNPSFWHGAGGLGGFGGGVIVVYLGNTRINDNPFGLYWSVWLGVYGQNPYQGLLQKPKNNSTPLKPTKPPCNHSGSGQGSVNVSGGKFGVGPTGGVIVTPNKVHGYAGISVGASAPTVGVSIMGRNGTDVSPGLNYSFSLGSVIGFQYSGKLDLHNIRASLKSGSFSFGGTTPNVSASLVYVSKGAQIPCL